MSSILNTTARVRHVTPVAPPASREAAVALLHDHAHFLSCNPHTTKSEPTAVPSPPPALPGRLAPSGTGSAGWACFRVTDVVNALPAGLWSSEILSEYEFCRIERGVFVRTRSPLGIVMEATWEIDDDQEKGGLVLVEDLSIKCSRLLVGVLKSQCEGGWKEIHERMLAPLQESR